MGTFITRHLFQLGMGDILAVIPALKDNGDPPSRNLQEIKGTSLVEIAIRQATNSGNIDTIVLNSDSDEILAEAEGYDVIEYNRPERFAQKDRFMEIDRLLIWQVEQLEAEGYDVDLVVLLYPTSPLRTIEKIDETIDKVLHDEYDSCLTLYEDTRYLWKKEGNQVVPMNYDPQKRAPGPLEDWNQWVENKAVYAVEKDTLFRMGSRLGDNIGIVEMPQHRSFDIQTEVDFELARFISEVDGVSW